MAAHELLCDRRSALREDDLIINLTLSFQPYKARQQSSSSDFRQHARNYGIVDSAMGEEVFVLDGQDRIANDGRDILVLGELPVFPCQLDKRLVVGIVDGADRRKLKAGERFHVGQVGSVKIDVTESNCDESGCNHRYANEQVNDAALPTQPVYADTTNCPSRRQGSAPGTPEPS
jgi:hypothetical protein